MKALIVDDEEDICFLLSGILRQKQLTTAYVTNLREARKSLEIDVPSIVFLDNHLPDGFGLDFIKHLKSNYPSTKVVMITAHDGPLERKTAAKEGADLFISKPFTREIIEDALSQLT